MSFNFGFLFTVQFTHSILNTIYFSGAIKTQKLFITWREWRENELERDFKYCHPRWPQETEYLESEIKGVRSLSFITDSDWWMYFDWVALVSILATIASHITFFCFNTNTSKEVSHFYKLVYIYCVLTRREVCTSEILDRPSERWERRYDISLL